jgi:nitrogenase molybdenum-iron protein alpha/beta subunit
MSKSCQEESIHYCSPAHGGWGIVRVGMLVPESYQLFVCPFACGRHGALGAYQQGSKHRLSYLYINETDIVSGSYEELIEEAIGHLLEAIEYSPKVIFIGVSCLDDLLGTDHEALLERLNQSYGLQFQVIHMNPITIDSKTPPPVHIQKNIYALTDGGCTNNHTLNFLGNFVPVDKQNELFEVLVQLGIEKTRHISEAATFEEFKEMGQSQYNIVVRPEALEAAKDMEKLKGIPYCFIPVSYDFETIKMQYEALKGLINKEVSLDLSDYEEKARLQVKKVQELVGRTSIAIDMSSVCRPYNLAKALLSYGFNVTAVYADKLSQFEQDSKEWLKAHAPHVTIYPAQHHKMIKRDQLSGLSDLAIGYNAGYMSGAKSVVNLVYDETMFGYQGVCKLMEKIEEAYLHPKDLQTMINAYGLVV